MKTRTIEKKRMAQLVAEAVAVLCPWCSEPQPNPTDGSEQWTDADFKKLHPTRTCVSCEGRILIHKTSKVMFL